jgi:hypothetical protein
MDQASVSWSGLPHGTRHCHLLAECGRDALGMTLTYEEMRWLGALPEIPNLTAQRYERLCASIALQMLQGHSNQPGACQIYHARESCSSNVIWPSLGPPQLRSGGHRAHLVKLLRGLRSLGQAGQSWCGASELVPADPFAARIGRIIAERTAATSSLSSFAVCIVVRIAIWRKVSWIGVRV